MSSLAKPTIQEIFSSDINRLRNFVRNTNYYLHGDCNKIDLVALVMNYFRYDFPSTPISNQLLRCQEQIWPLDGIKVIAFDIDGVVVGNIPRGFPSGPFIALSLMKYLRHCGYIVVVVSCSNQKRIQKIFADSNFDINSEHILTPDIYGISHCTDLPSSEEKNDLLTYLSIMMNVDPQEIILVDDKMKNLEWAVKKGYRGLLVPPVTENGGLVGRHFGLRKNEIESNMTMEKFISLWKRWTKSNENCNLWIYK